MPAKNLYVENSTGLTLYLVLVVSRREGLLNIHVYDEDPGEETERTAVANGRVAQFPADGLMSRCIAGGKLNYLIQTHLDRLPRLFMTAGRYRLQDGPIIQLESAAN